MPLKACADLTASPEEFVRRERDQKNPLGHTSLEALVGLKRPRVPEGNALELQGQELTGQRGPS